MIRRGCPPLPCMVTDLRSRGRWLWRISGEVRIGLSALYFISVFSLVQANIPFWSLPRSLPGGSTSTTSGMSSTSRCRKKLRNTSTGETCWFIFVFIYNTSLCYARIGRTGRVGNTGRATSFVDMRADSGVIPQLVNILVDAGQPVPDWMGGSGGRVGRPRNSGFEWSAKGGRGGRSTGFGNGY